MQPPLTKTDRIRRRRPLIYAILVVIIGLGLWIHGRYTRGKLQVEFLKGKFSEFLAEQQLNNVISCAEFEELILKKDHQIAFIMKLNVIDPEKLKSMSVKLDQFPLHAPAFDKFAKMPECRFIKNQDIHRTALIVSDGTSYWLIGNNWTEDSEKTKGPATQKMQSQQIQK